PKNREKCLGRKVLQFDLVFIQVVQDLVLVLGRQLGVGLAVMALATVGVHTRDRLAIQLSRGFLQLVALLVRPRRPRSFHIPAVGAAVWPRQLAIYEDRNARLEGAGVLVVTGYEPCRGGLNEAVFVRREECAAQGRPLRFVAAGGQGK